MRDATAVERLLRRDRSIAVAGVALLTALAWLYLLTGAGLGMSAWDMTSLAPFPHQQAGGMAMAPAAWEPSVWALMVAMWWVMMIAMMAPSAAPTILLYAQVHRQSVTQGATHDGLAPTGAFASGYLSVWLAFSVAATALQWALEQSGLVAAMAMGSQSRWLSSAVLVAAGLYQLSPLKGACLSHCRSPAAFLSRHWRPRAAGAFRLGALHGAYCAGCCWLLMVLLFVGGVMNVIWIAALAVLVLLEKLHPAGRWLARAAGIALIAWGVATLFA